jgi:hypothetical protein
VFDHEFRQFGLHQLQSEPLLNQQGTGVLEAAQMRVPNVKA